jgi:para-aminobenzoate synthetase component I
MSIFRPDVRTGNGDSVTERHEFREVARLEWRVGDAGDPSVVLSSFLERFGLGLPPGQSKLTESKRLVADARGAMVFVSANGGAAMLGVSRFISPGSPSPIPCLPDVVAVIFETPNSVPFYDAAPSSAPSIFGRSGDWRLGPWRPSWTEREHATAVASVREAIARGDVYQVNLVGHASASYQGDPMPALRRITDLPGARHPYLLSGDGWAMACASPETLVRVVGRRVETLPIKGTRPATPTGRSELLSSAKERAEHIMIVDLERNDLAHVARTGTVNVPELFVVRRWCDLWQAESRVVAELADGVDLAALLRAVCPGGSVTGAPKVAALAQIAALEPVGRGPSMGALGWLDRDTLELGLTIRTVAVDGDRVHVWAGGGITWDSDPEAEVAEAAAKAAPLRAALAGD